MSVLKYTTIFFPGNPLFYDVRNEFYRDAHGILLVFDVSDRSSFESLTRWPKIQQTKIAVMKI